MTQIFPPRNSGQKRVLSRNSILMLLWLVAALCLWWNLYNANKLGNPNAVVRHSSSSSNNKLRQQDSKKTDDDDGFDWAHLDVSQNVKGMCGADKCFWRSSSEPDSVGYLVASAGYHYKRMNQAYNFAVEVLDQKCQAGHLFLQAPQKVNISSAFAKKLNSLKHNDQKEYAIANGLKKNKTRNVFDEDDPYVVVQKVKVAPKPNLMFGFMQSKWEMMVEHDLPRFRSILQSEGMISLKQIEEKLELQRKGIECAMEHSETYWYDLQGLIDLEGNYFHMDIDSQFWAQIGDPEDEENEITTVTRDTAYKRRHNLIGRFNEMIQRLVYPPPEGVEELPAWRKGEGPGRHRKKTSDSSDDEE